MTESPDDLLEHLNTYEIRDPNGTLLTTVQGNDPRSVLGVMMLVWGEGIRVTQVNESRPAPTVPGAYTEVETLDCHREPGQYAFHESLPPFAVDPVMLPKKTKAIT